MAHPQTLGNESPGYYVIVEDTGTQTTDRDFYLLEHTQDASTQTADEDVIQLKSTQDTSTQISEGGFSPLKKFNAEEVNSTVTSETLDENRKRKLMSGQMNDGNYLKRHISNLPAKHFYCNVCKLSYSKKGSHAASDQTCNVCKENFECQKQLEDHYSIHAPHYETNCRICEKKIDEHYTMGERGKQYKCCFSECKYRGQCKSHLKRHLYTHSDLNLFRCKICEKHFKSISGERNHFNKTHPLCKLCGKIFFNSRLLNEHLCEGQGKSHFLYVIRTWN